MAESPAIEPWKELARLARDGSVAELQEFVAQLGASDLAMALSRLAEEDQAQVLTRLPPEKAADLIEQLPDFQAVDLIEQLETKTAAAILDHLPSDEQADVIGDLPAPDAESILRQMAPEEARDARVLSQYTDDVAGGLMITEFLSYPESSRVRDVLDDLRTNAARYRDYDIQYAYVADEQGRLTGVLPLRDLLLAIPTDPIRGLMIASPRSIADDAGLAQLVNFFDRHQFLGVPVTDAGGKLVGVVRRTAVDEARRNRDDDDFLKVQGIVGGEEVRTMPLLRRTGKRLSWLSINILLNIMAASVIAYFQDTLEAVIALAVFLPIISDMSGCSGNQAVAVSLRELSLGFVQPTEVLRVWSKEIMVGILNGLALGSLIAGVAVLWQGNLYLGLVVGLALALNTMVAVSIGGVVPLLLRHFKMDPAIGSGPILTTITDMCGFFLVLSIASALLPYLV